MVTDGTERRGSDRSCRDEVVMQHAAISLHAIQKGDSFLIHLSSEKSGVIQVIALFELISATADASDERR